MPRQIIAGKADRMAKKAYRDYIARDDAVRRASSSVLRVMTDSQAFDVCESKEAIEARLAEKKKREEEEERQLVEVVVARLCCGCV